MSNDSVSVTTQQSWFGRIGSALAGVVIGLILFVASFPFLTWNEGRAIHREKTLEAGARDVISVSADSIDPANEGKLVHVSGRAEPEGPAVDSTFALAVPAVALRRTVEMYQWSENEKTETREKLGGGQETVTTYTYEKRWMETLVNSQNFHRPEGHLNPSEMPLETRTFRPGSVRLGAFTLPPDLLDRLNDFQGYPITRETSISLEGLASARLWNEGLYVGQDPQSPAVGDLRVRFEVIPAGPVTAVARQVGSTFEPFTVPRLGEIAVLRPGTMSADAVFAAEAQDNAVLTWLLRLAGFLMMLVGLLFISRPFAVVASVVPFLGSLVGMGFFGLALIVALPLTLATIALAWLAFRPLIGIPLLLLAGACIFFGARLLPRPKPRAA